jgi:hypothetical protein
MGGRKDQPRGEGGRYAKDGAPGEPAKPAPKKPARKRAAPKGGIRWTKPKETIFFCELAMVCNVSAALRAAKLAGCSSLAYERRKKDKAFRAAWESAIDQSYAMLELEMLERARFGKDRPPPATEAEKRLRAIPDSLALQLLKLYETRVKARASSAPGRGAGAAEPRLTRQRRAELRREFDALLSDFNRRMGGQG